MTDPATPDPAPEPKRCVECQAPLTPEDIAVCGNCADARSAAHKQRLMEQEQQNRIERWLAICPPLYRATAWTQHPELSQVCREAAKHWWTPGKGIGLGLYGQTGSGKTRAMFEVLRRHHFAGRHVMAIQSMDIEEACSQLFQSDPIARQDARRTLERCRKAGILYIDDLGKERMTDPVAREFHRLIEHRNRHRLPTCWTSEQTGDWLIQRMGPAYGDGLIRRLREFTDIRSVNP